MRIKELTADTPFGRITIPITGNVSSVSEARRQAADTFNKLLSEVMKGDCLPVVGAVWE